MRDKLMVNANKNMTILFQINIRMKVIREIQTENVSHKEKILYILYF